MYYLSILTMKVNALAYYLLFIAYFFMANIAFGQGINTFPYDESFETTFTTGKNVAFIPYWTGNDVRTTSRIFQGNDARTGAHSINVIPTSSFSGEILTALDLTGVNNPIVELYAFSKQNGSASSSRPAIVHMATSVDGGSNYLDTIPIGDDTSFPNNNSTSYTSYTYELPPEASNQPNVIVKLTVSRSTTGSGSCAEFVMDDVLIRGQSLPLGIASVVADTSTRVTVTFNQAVDSASATTIANYTIDQGIVVHEVTFSAIDEVVLTTSAMPNGRYELVARDVADAATQTPVTHLTDHFTYAEPLSILSLGPLNKNTLQVVFNLPLSQGPAEGTSHYSVDRAIGNPVSVSMDTSDSHQVLLVFDSVFQENDYTLSINGVTDSSGLSVASGLSAGFSYLPLAVTAVEALTGTQIKLSFNQNVTAVTAEALGNYSVDFGYGNPTVATLDPSDTSSVFLTFSEAFANNTYQITVREVSNTLGNATAENISFAFTQVTPTGFRGIVINEIFADPTGNYAPDPQPLPSGAADEFIELYNTSSKAIDLAGFDLTGGTVSSFVLEPDSYVLLTSTSNVEEFQVFGKVAGVSSWNGLTNSGEQIVLRDNLGHVVDSLTYGLDWYGNDDKSDGGWSLERINPFRLCSDVDNWTANNTIGGTPAAVNAAFDDTPDSQSPDLIAVVIHSATELTLYFSEMMDTASLNRGVYALDHQATVANVHVSFKSAWITLDSPLISGTTYTLTVEGLTDCSGNAIDRNSHTFFFDDQPPAFQRIVLKGPEDIELVFDEPVTSNPAETEENFSIDPEIGTPRRSTLDEGHQNRIRLSFTQPMTVGRSYSLSITHLSDTLGNVMDSLAVDFTFENSIDSVQAISSQLVDVLFTEPLDKASAENVGNYQVSDEVGHPKAVILDADDPKLVHLVFENSLKENSGLVISFDDIKNVAGNFLNTLHTTFIYDTKAPKVDSVSVVSSHSVLVSFNEKIEKVAAETVNHYTVDNDIGHPSTARIQADRHSVLLSFDVPFEEESANKLSVENIKDLFGNQMTNKTNRVFYYDQQPPTLSGLTLRSPTSLELTFSEAVKESTASLHSNYSLGLSRGHATAARRAPEDSTKVLLTFENGFGSHTINHLTIEGIADSQGNTLDSSITVSFSSLYPEIGQVMAKDENSLSIQFTKTLDPIAAEDKSLYDFEGLTIDSVYLDSLHTSLLHLTFNETFVENRVYVFTIQNLSDTDGNVAAIINGQFSYDTQVLETYFLNEHSLTVHFKVPMDKFLGEDPSHFIVDGDIGNPLSVTRDDEALSKLTFLFSNAFRENEPYKMRICHLKDIYGRPIPCAEKTLVYDKISPVIESVTPLHTHQLVIRFSEPVTTVSAIANNHYQLDHIGQPVTIGFSSETPTEAILSFAGDLEDGLSYRLAISRIKDLSGNMLHGDTVSFTFKSPYNPGFREIIIHELMADPGETITLPNSEYIELFNKGNREIKLGGFTIQDRVNVAALPDFGLLPGGHVILAPTASVPLFDEYGGAIGLANFPTLGNTGDQLILKDRNGEVIDSLTYDRSFYRDDAKRDGGFSLEMVNPFATCFDKQNWLASDHGTGGTPGAQNSVLDTVPDQHPPEVIAHTITNDSQLQITFDESMDITSLIHSHFSMDHEANVDSITLTNPFGTSVTVHLSTALEAGKAYTLTLSGISDCSGNQMPVTKLPFAIGAPPAFHEIIITELMANPEPTVGLPTTEYIELYNRSDKILSLQGLTVADAVGISGEVSYASIQPGEYSLIVPSNRIALFENIENVIGVTNFPNLNTTGDQMTLFDASGSALFKVNYEDSWYRDREKAVGGWSLEMIDPNFPCQEANNWAASESLTGGTPGFLNAVNGDNPDIMPPMLIEAFAISANEIHLSFNEKLEVEGIDLSDFTVNGNITCDAYFLKDEKNIGLVTVEPLQPNVPYQVTVNHITDCSGNLITPGHHSMELVLPDSAIPSDIVINEILFNPKSGGVRFVELYNRSHKYIRLKDWSLAGATNSYPLTSSEKIFPPQSYQILTNDLDILKSHYPKAETDNGLEMANLPSFPTNEGSVTILNRDSLIIDHFDYSEDYHSPLLDDVDGVSLEKIRVENPGDDPHNWQSASSTENYATPGYQNSQSKPEVPLNGTLTISPKTFAPDLAGSNNFTTINYQFDSPGNLINVTIYDPTGRVLKDLVQNSLVGTSGFFTWDGTTNDGSKARIGYYLILFEVVSAEGNISYIKESVAIGTRF